MEDAELVDKILGGEIDAFREIVRGHGSVLRAFFAGALNSRAAVEDLVQETFLVVYDKLAEYDRNRPLGPWIKGVARIKLLNHLREYYKLDDKTVPFEVEVMRDLCEDPLYFADEEETRRLLEGLRGCVKGLPDRSRLLIRMRYYENASVKKMAEVIRLSSTAITTTLHRIRQALRHCVEKAVEV